MVGGSLKWPVRLPNLNPLDFFLGSFIGVDGLLITAATLHLKTYYTLAIKLILCPFYLKNITSFIFLIISELPVFVGNYLFIFNRNWRITVAVITIISPNNLWITMFRVGFRFG